MNDRETARHEMFGRGQTFGTDNAADMKEVSHRRHHAQQIQPRRRQTPRLGRRQPHRARPTAREDAGPSGHGRKSGARAEAVAVRRVGAPGMKFSEWARAFARHR